MTRFQSVALLHPCGAALSRWLGINFNIGGTLSIDGRLSFLKGGTGCGTRANRAGLLQTYDKRSR